MKDTAPKGMGIIAVAAVFGIIAAGVALVLYDYSWIGALFIGAIIAAITAVVLMLGWRDPAPHGDLTASREAAPAPTPSHTHAAAPAPVADPEPLTAPEPVAASKPEPEVVAEPAPAPEPAPEAPKPAPAAKVLPSTVLPGQAELESKKGEWKYDGPGSDAAPAAETGAPATSAEGSKPEFLSEAREGGPDDLKQIKGVGPKLEKTLHGMGIYHFDQIATWGPAEQAWIDDNLEGFKGRATRDNWVEQAQTLAAGGTTEFSSKVKKGDVY